MYKQNNIGVIGCVPSGKNSIQSIMSLMTGSTLSKVMYASRNENLIAIEGHPEAQIVDDRDSILNDDKIDLVIVAASESSNLNHVSAVLKAGKQVRIL